MRKYTPIRTQEVGEQERRIFTKLAAVFHSLLPKGSKYISILYIPGGDTGLKARVSSDMPDDLVAKCLREAAEAVEAYGIQETITKEDLKKADN